MQLRLYQFKFIAVRLYYLFVFRIIVYIHITERNCNMDDMLNEYLEIEDNILNVDSSITNDFIVNSSSSHHNNDHKKYDSNGDVNDDINNEESYDNKTNEYYKKLGFLEIISALYFTISSCYICGIEYLKYKVGYKTKTNTIIDIATRLSAKNMLYVKIFQAFATNKTILNDELNKFFSNYTDNVEYSSSEYDISELKQLEELSTNYYPYKQLRIMNDYVPIKSGLMSLIFKGTFEDVGDDKIDIDPDSLEVSHTKKQTVVIKYLRKDIHNNFNSSMNNLVLFAKITKKIPYLRTLNIESLILQNVVSLKDQVCFRKEVQNIQSYYKNWKDCDYVKIPLPYPEFTEKVNPNIIIMDFIEGKKINEIDHNDNEKFAIILASFNVKAAFCNSLFHGDLHPGNILFIKEKLDDDTYKYKIGILDFGIIGNLTRQDQEILFSSTKLMYQKKYKKLIEYILTNMTECLIENNNSNNYYYHLPEEEYIVLFNKLHSAIVEYSTPELKFFGVNEMYNINFILNSYGFTFKRTLYKLFITLAIMDSIGAEIGNKLSYMQHLTDIVVDLFGIDIGDCKDDE